MRGRHCSDLMRYKSTESIAVALHILHFEITVQYPLASQCELQRADRFRNHASAQVDADVDGDCGGIEYRVTRLSLGVHT